MIRFDNKPLVSFVIPVFNSEITLAKCVESVIKQTFGNIEIILVNNMSTDRSLSVCNELASLDDRVRVFDIPEKGVSSARNKGIEVAKGEYVAFVDADDWIDDNVCELFAKENDRYGYDLFCYSAQYHRDTDVVESFLFSDDVLFFSKKDKEELQLKIFSPKAPCFSYKVNTRFAGSVWGKIYKRSVLLENNLRFAVETVISEDCLFNTLALDYFQRIGYTKKSFYHYLQQEDSAQNRYRPDSEKYFLFIIRKIQIWLKETNKSLLFNDAANCLFIHYLFGILKEDLFHKNNESLYEQKEKKLKEILAMTEFNELFSKINKSFFSLPELCLIWLLRKRLIKIISLVLKFC